MLSYVFLLPKLVMHVHELPFIVDEWVSPQKRIHINNTYKKRKQNGNILKWLKHWKLKEARDT
jgi:hypothetical protein